MIAPAVFALVFQLLPPSPVPAVEATTPPPAPDVLFELVKKTKAFGAESGRTALQVTPSAPVRVPGIGDQGYFLEFQWTDKAEAAHTGVAVVAHASVLEVPWAVKPAPGAAWGLVQVFEDKPIGGLMDELKRTRIAANEAMAISDVRTFVTGQMLFMSLADGAYGEFKCLRVPAECIVGIPPEPMMQPEMLAAEKRGYRRKFHPGAPVSNAKAKISPAPFLKSFAYTAVPVVPGETGVRGFCADPSGRICVTSDGREPAVKDGACAIPCTELPATGRATAPAASKAPAK